MRQRIIFLGLAIMFSSLAFAQSQQKIEATRFTKEANKKVANELPLADKQDYKDAIRGFIATTDNSFIPGEGGKNIQDLDAWNFLDAEAPHTVNPSLWRVSQLNKLHGLFEVLPNKIYQIRGFDVANMTFVKTNNSWIVIDVLLSKETATEGYNLIKKHVADLPIAAIIITHPHPDHFGGIAGVLENAPNKNIEIIAPTEYFDGAVSSTFMGGGAMGRRGDFMFGRLLDKNAHGTVGVGLGQASSKGKKYVSDVTKEIHPDGETLVIDGLEIEFLSVPGAEAPSEIMFYIPSMKSFCVAEEMTRTMHNLLTLRGEKVRDGKLWSKYIDQTLQKYGDDVEISFSTHHWPVWENKTIANYWEQQRDMYRYLHDQTLNLANKGYTPKEIAEMIELPESLRLEFFNREYYGTISHNTKAQYQMYYGWYDGVPANLNPLPPTEESCKYVEALGGEEATLAIAQKAYDNGEYRWAATLTNNLVFANPQNKNAKELLANIYTQQGYQAESGPWRNFYLQGAKELLEGVQKPATASKAIMAVSLNVGLEMLFDQLAIHVNGEQAAGKDIILNIELTDTKEIATLILKNGALTNRIGVHHDEATISISGKKQILYNSFAQPEAFNKYIKSGDLIIDGDKGGLDTLLATLEPSDRYFNIIEP